MTGKVRIGVTVMVSVWSYDDSRVMHISRGWPLISALHEPHLPALQFQRTARSGACSACSRWIASRTTSPSSTGTVNDSKSPPDASPRQTRMFRSCPMSVRLLEQRLEVVGHLRQRLAVDLDGAALLVQDEVHPAPLGVGGRIVVAGVPATALLASQRRSRDALGDCQHRPQVQRGVPAGVVVASGALHG